MAQTENNSKQVTRAKWIWIAGVLSFVYLLGVVAMPFVQNYQTITYFESHPGTFCLIESSSFLASLQAADQTYLRSSFSKVLLRLFGTVKDLGVTGASIGDKDLLYLRGFKDLENLDLYNTQITNAGLVHLKELPNLKVLHIRKTEVDHEGLVQLKELSNLRVIWMNTEHLTKQGLEQIKEALPKCSINLINDD